MGSGLLVQLLAWDEDVDPEAQRVQLSTPTVAAYVPARQIEQSVAPSFAAKRPAAQPVHDVCPVPLANWPGSQLGQVDEVALAW